MPKVKPQSAEIEDDFDFDEVVDEQKPQRQKKSSFVLDEDLRIAITQIVADETQDIRDEQKKMAKRVDRISESLKEQAKLTTTLKTQNEAVMKAMSRIDDSVKVDVDDTKPVASTEAVVEVKQEKGIVGKTLGAIGNVAHGIIDTAAFVLESTVDLVTLGNARK